MKVFLITLKRNAKLFFKDKGLFFTSLITPLILLVLYATFLSNVYEQTFVGIFEAFEVKVDKNMINGLVGGQLMSSLLAVSCVTVSFCSNMLMVQDKITGANKDFSITPVKRSTLAFSYYVSTTLVTLIICFIALTASLIYVACVGWYISFTDVLLMILDVFILVMFGTALSSIINFFLSSQGQISAVGTIISAGYGFICGAYMPISSFGTGLQKVLSFLPGTYGTSLIRNHSLSGVLLEMQNQGIPAEAINGLKDLLDCNLYFFETSVEIPTMYLILGISVIVLVGAYILMNVLKKKDK